MGAFPLLSHRTGVSPSVSDIRRGTFGDVRSLLISRDDSSVAEYYFGSADRETVAPIYSVTKSVTSLLFSIAIAEAAIPSPDAPLAAVLRA